ncbi:GtrA family protein [Alteribacillus bidgolensis]|uniref:Putative flippase GtrA (Transmembrane translocase of bactoprenol-linked glucose) n=1 Tax=Alteribacillus bidgolensis TaxID=930129 RepID=A0A1G8MLH9_9BACI|nr:GtrA family protein [Alteribacillus bidgolensis]SDI68839.1 Putative flippase GtrA (transmembrane translocase of bactoprenol-linked glucose) [Alteribacillus bidgolensis]
MKKRVFQFSSIGILNAAIDIVILNLFLWIWPTSNNTLLFIFNSLAYFCAITNSYFWNSRFTFYHFSDFGWKEKAFFLLQALIAWMINNLFFIGILNLFYTQDLLSLPSFVFQNISKGLAMFLSFTGSFFMMKHGVFRYRKSEKL